MSINWEQRNFLEILRLSRILDPRLSIEQFCKDRNVSPETLRYWRKKFPKILPLGRRCKVIPNKETKTSIKIISHLAGNHTYMRLTLTDRILRQAGFNIDDTVKMRIIEKGKIILELESNQNEENKIF